MGPVSRPQPAADPVEALNLRLLKLETRLQRERAARLQAEAIAEKGLSDLYERQRELMLLETVATNANQSRSVEETFRLAVEAVCSHANWPFGHVYMLTSDGVARLEPTSIWHSADPVGHGAFIAATGRTTLLASEGLPGQALADGNALWIEDLDGHPNFPRAAAARQCGFAAAFLVPILLRSEVLAVAEFYLRDPNRPEESFVSLLGQIGNQLSRVLERKRTEEKLIHDASHDPLTLLPNRLLFTDRLERAIAAHRRRPENGFAVLFIDLDRFKLVNDSLGHAAGDILLIEIARRLSRALGVEFNGGAEEGVATLARLGGDEFTVLIEELPQDDVAVRIAERLQETLRLPMTIEGQEVYSSASIGVVSSKAGCASAADFMRNADLAMYRAKSEGRARIEVFDDSLHATAKQRLALESDLRGALQRGEFLLHYQPIVALEGNLLVGFEALIRWRRSSGEIVPPSEFIPLAEETGLIVFIGDWVMREAFSTLAEWQRAHPRATPLTMSVNVSPRQFHQPDFVDQVLEATSAAGVDPASVRLEITESVTIRDAERTIAILQKLRAAGIRVSIDDFGTGYSSLSYLHQLPFDTLKIDRSFVSALSERTGGDGIIRTILDLARNLKMEVVAEGAETPTHVAQLRTMGCDFAQGYIFSRPLSRTAAASLLEAASVLPEPPPGEDFGGS